MNYLQAFQIFLVMNMENLSRWPILFGVQITQSDTLNFELTNPGSESVTVVRLSEDPENSGSTNRILLQ